MEEFQPIIAARKISVPSLILYSTGDKIFRDSRNSLNALYKVIENCDTHLFETAGHSTMSKQEDYDGVLSSFVDKHGLLELK